MVTYCIILMTCSLDNIFSDIAGWKFKLVTKNYPCDQPRSQALAFSFSFQGKGRERNCSTITKITSSKTCKTGYVQICLPLKGMTMARVCIALPGNRAYFWLPISQWTSLAKLNVCCCHVVNGELALFRYSGTITNPGLTVNNNENSLVKFASLLSCRWTFKWS